MTEKILREMIREELLRIVEVAQHQNPSGRWEDEVWVAEDGPPHDHADEAATKKHRYKGRTYRASAGSLAGDIEDVGSFKWADKPWAAKQAATIVKTGHPIRKKGKKK